MSDQYLRRLHREWHQSGVFEDFLEWSLASSRFRHLSGDHYELTQYIMEHLVVFVNDWWLTVADEPEDTRWTINVSRGGSGHGRNFYTQSTIALERTRGSLYGSPELTGWTYTGWGIGISLGFPEMTYSLSFSAFPNSQDEQVAAVIEEFLESLGFISRN